jgi:hypothetical protein
MTSIEDIESYKHDVYNRVDFPDLELLPNNG